MKLVYVLALLALVGSCYSQQNPFDLSVTYESFEYIPSNMTMYLDQIHFHGRSAYVAGQSFIRQINFEPFEVTHWPYFHERHPFLDFRVFQDSKNESWAVGPIPNQIGLNDNGFNYPLYIAGSSIEHAEAPPGHYLMASVEVEEINGQIYAFFAGWHQHVNASAGANFTLIRTRVDPSHAGNIPGQGNVFNYNFTDEHDRVDLHSDGFQAFNRLFKPWIFHSPTYNHLVVVDPSSNAVYRVHSNVSEPLGMLNSTRVTISHQPIVGATYDRISHRLYLGTQGLGWASGTIIVIDVFTMTVVKNLTLGKYESHPNSLQLDWGGGNHTHPLPSNHIFINLYGSRLIIKMDLKTWETVGFITLPPGLKNVYNILVTPWHVYFTTYDQFSVVGRTNITSFCSTPCDHLYGYCSNGRCACRKDFTLNKDGERCDLATPPPVVIHDTVTNYERGGEVALGILFAIAVVAGVVGWYQVYKIKNGSTYAPIANA